MLIDNYLQSEFLKRTNQSGGVVLNMLFLHKFNTFIRL